MLKKSLLTLVIAVALVGCGGTPTKEIATDTAVAGSVTSPISGTAKITIEGFAFAPAAIVVKKGTVIEVTNKDLSSHTFTADLGAFDTGLIAKGVSSQLTMDTVGTFAYHCTPHPNMTGTITVVE